MRFRRIAVFCLIALGASSAVFAKGYSPFEGAKRFFLGGQFGYGNSRYELSDALSTAVSSGTVDKNGHMAGRVYGGYNFNPNIAVEMGFGYFRKVEINNINGSGTNLKITPYFVDLLAKLTVPLQNNFAIYGKAGGAFVRVDRTYSAAITGAEGRKQKFRPTAALGVSYAFSDTVSGDISWQRVFGGSSIKNLDLAAAGLQFSFG